MIVPSTVADRFDVEATVGEGGMGEVFRALDRATGERVALKILKESTDASVERFLREVTVLSGLAHPAIVRHVAHGRMPDGSAWLAMEWLDGEDLATTLRRGPLTIEASITLVRCLCEALAAAHAHGVVHRDVKPANVFIVGGDVARAKLLDFGIALRPELAARVTRTGHSIGTPGYMSPEQARGDRAIDARADLFSVGALLYECIVGRPAFEGAHVVAVLARILLEDAPRLRSAVPEAPRWLDALIARLLAKEPGLRPPSAEDVLSLITREGAAATGSPRSTSSSLRPSIGRDERRVVSVIVAAAGPADGPVSVEAATVASSGVGPGANELLAALGLTGARAAMLLDGSLVVAITGADTAVDQAVRAVRAAFALQAATESPRIVVATGLVVVTDRVPVGEVLDRAVLLLSTRDWQGVRADEVTADLIGEHFALANGQGARAILGELVGGEGARAGARRTPFMGRDHELALLEATWAACADGQGARAVVVTAPAGVGKSRLRRELSLRLALGANAPLLLVGRGAVVGGGAAYGVIGPVLRRAAGILDGEPLESQRDKLCVRVSRRLGPDGVSSVAPFLGELAGIPFSEVDDVPLRAARSNPVLMADRIRIAWREWLAAECDAAPVLLVLEDLQWGDLPTVQLVDDTLRVLSEARFMVLALARPEVDARFPRLWADRQSVELRLAPLARRPAERLVRAVLGDGVAAGVVEGIVARAEGNALFLEELVRAAGAGEVQAPATILAIVQTRFDALPSDVRRVLRAASVFGTVFWTGGVAELVASDTSWPDVEQALQVLGTRDFVEPRSRSRIAGESEHWFRHELVREAAYASLTEEDRALGHLLAGQWLEAHAQPNTVELAEHFERGRDPVKAASWLVRAARESLDANDFAGAVERAERVASAGDEIPSELRMNALLVQAVAHRWQFQPDSGARCASRVLELALPGSKPWFAALAEQVLSTARVGDMDGLMQCVDRALSTAPLDAPSALQRAETLLFGTGHLVFSGNYRLAADLLAQAEEIVGADIALHPLIDARASLAHGALASANLDPRRALACHSAAADAFVRAGDVRSAAASRVNAGVALIELGRAEDAIVLLRAALSETNHVGATYARRFAMSNLGWALARAGRYAEAQRCLDEALDGEGRGRLFGSAAIYRAWIARRQRDLASAITWSEAAIAAVESFAPMLVLALALYADALRESGQLERAAVAADRAETILASLGNLDECDAIARLALAEVWCAVGRTNDARRMLRQALARIEQACTRLTAPGDRDVFLAVDEHVRIRELAASLG